MYKNDRSDFRSFLGIAAVLFVIAMAFYGAMFFLYVGYVGFPRHYPTDHDGIFSGFAHGLFVIPNFVVSLFDETVAVYQKPNDGNPYLIGFVIGVLSAFSSTSSSGASASTITSRNR